MKSIQSFATARPLIGAACLAAATLAGCAGMNETGRNSAIGAGVGALGGAAIGRNATGAAIGAGVGALGGYAWSQYMQQKKASMEQATVGTGIAVTQTPDNQLKVNIPSDVSFDTNSAVIRPNMRPVLDQFAYGVANQPNTEIRVIGHTDNTGTDAINDPLSVQRAQSVRDYLAARGVNPQQVAISGAGDRQPVADNRTTQGRAENRRVEMFLAERAVSQGATSYPVNQQPVQAPATYPTTQPVQAPQSAYPAQYPAQYPVQAPQSAYPSQSPVQPPRPVYPTTYPGQAPAPGTQPIGPTIR